MGIPSIRKFRHFASFCRTTAVTLTAALLLVFPLRGIAAPLPRLYEILQAPGVARYYRFLNPQQYVQNTGDGIEPLLLQQEQTNHPPQSVTGRMKGKTAVRLSGDMYLADSCPFATNALSVAVWLRLLGPARGITNAASGPVSGRIVQNGAGTFDGWRLSVDDTQTRRVRFDLGGSNRGVSVLSDRPLSYRAWNHVAVSWDGAVIRLFLNGIPAGERTCDIPFTQPKGDLLVGGREDGGNALDMEIESLLLYDGAFTQKFTVSQLFRSEANPAKARSLYDALLGSSSLPPAKRLSVVKDTMENEASPLFLRAMGADRLIAEAGSGMPINSSVLSDLQDVREMDDATTRKMELTLVDAHLRERNPTAAQEVLKRLFLRDIPDPLQRAFAYERRAEAFFQCGFPAKAKEQLERIRKESSLSAPLRAFAALALARLLQDAGAPADAARLYREAADIPLLPSYLTDELQQSARSCVTSRAAVATQNQIMNPVPPLPRSSMAFYVAPGGNDALAGSFDAPFRTLERARDAVRAQKSNGILPPGGVTVFLRGGVYARTNGFSLADIDSGSFNAPVVYAAYPGEKPVLDGGFPVCRLAKVKDSARLARLAEKARGNVRMVNIRKQGFLDKSDLTIVPPVPLHLYEDGQPLPLESESTKDILRPGEWFLDRDTGELYVWPLRHPWVSEFRLARLACPMIHVCGAREAIFRGLTLQCSRQHGIVLEEGKSVRIENCVFRNLGGKGVVAEKTMNLRVFGNRLTFIGGTGIAVSGGNRRSLAPSYAVVENNELSQTGLDFPGTPALLLEGCAILARRNYLHDGPAAAIELRGNDHTVEYNRMERMGKTGAGQGAVDINGDPSFWGNLIRGNLFRDIGNKTSGKGACAVRLAGGVCGTIIYANRFENTGTEETGAVRIDGGEYNIVDGNRFTGNAPGIHFSSWGEEKWHAFVTGGQGATCLLTNVCAQAFPYRTRYPEIIQLWKKSDVNHVWRNQFIGLPQDLLHKPSAADLWANRSLEKVEFSETNKASLFSPPLPPLSEIGLYGKVAVP